jgi:sugar-phosphatase
VVRFECDALLFDLDGVLIDSTVCVVRHWKEWAAWHGVDLDLILAHAHGRRTVETMRLVAPHLPVEEESARFAAMEAQDAEGVVAIDGARDLLAALPPDAWAVVTSGSRAVATARMGKAALPVPGILVGADDVSRGKPDPEPYLLAAQRLRLSPGRCLVIEDAPAGIEAARRAGMQVIAVTATHIGQDLARADAVATCLADLGLVVRTEPGGRLAVLIR